MTMTFREALIAHLKGENVWVDGDGVCERPFGEVYRLLTLESLEKGVLVGVSFSIKPRTVLCNGVEVPAPESVAPEEGVLYYVPSTRNTDMPYLYRWVGDMGDKNWLSDGLVYLDRDACIARAKAMLITR